VTSGNGCCIAGNSSLAENSKPLVQDQFYWFAGNGTTTFLFHFCWNLENYVPMLKLTKAALRSFVIKHPIANKGWF
jgi:hypothetical protein